MDDHIDRKLMHDQQIDSITRRQNYKPTPHHPIGLPPLVELTESYKLFLYDLARGRRFRYFYKQMVSLRRDIILDTQIRTQKEVAVDLKMTPIKLSTLVRLLKEIDAPDTHVSANDA